MRRLRPFAFLLGLVLFALLLRMVDLNATWDLLKKAHLGWVLAAFAFALPEVALKSMRLHALALRLHSELPFKDALWIYLSGQPLATITPGKIGDVARVWGLSRSSRLSIPSSLAVHVADKVYDLITLALLASIGLIDFLMHSGNHMPAVASLLGILLGILFMVLILHPDWMRAVVKPAVLFLSPGSLSKQLQTHGHEFYQNFQNLFKPAEKTIHPAFLSVLAWETTVVRAFFCTLALGIALPLPQLALLLPAVIVIELLPISILGFGTREAALFFFFASSQSDYSALLSFSLLTLLVGPLTIAVLGIPSAMKLSTLAAKKHEKIIV
jgi:uncharacterized protein (TIRG00374 family)